jgi:uncharacterized protein YbjT (DUF2867 family)
MPKSIAAQATWYWAKQTNGRKLLLVDAAKAAQVQHFVHSSVGGADRKTGAPHFESKWQIEQYLRQSGLRYTILRPTSFMQNWYNFLREPILNGTLPLPLNPQTSLPQFSVEDIGAFASLAFQNPSKWLDRTIVKSVLLWDGNAHFSFPVEVSARKECRNIQASVVQSIKGKAVRLPGL